jgi:hypothetical protein
MGGLLCAIHQPNFFPRLSTLAKLFTADIWIILDDVQFARRDYQHRCHLAPVGDARLPERWLTVPVHLPSGRSTFIKDVQIAEPLPTLRRVTGLLHQYYRCSPYQASICGLMPQIAESFTRTGKLTEVSEDSTRALLAAVKWRGVIYRSSDLPARPGRSERLADLTRAVGAATYLCGTGGTRYLDPQPFTAHGLTIERFTVPQHPARGKLEGVRLVTVLTDLAAVGPIALAEQLREHACRPELAVLSCKPPRSIAGTVYVPRVRHH